MEQPEHRKNDKTEDDARNMSGKKPGLLKWSFALAVFVAVPCVILGTALLIECGVGPQPAGSWCGVGSITIMAFASPVILGLALGLAYLPLRLPISESLMRWTLIAIGALALSYCAADCVEENRLMVSVLAVNHTDEDIEFVQVGDANGLYNLQPRSRSDTACCLYLPRYWRSGRMLTIRWQGKGYRLKDEHGREVMRDGDRVSVTPPWKEKKVEIPEYDQNRIQRLDVHFYPNGKIRVIAAGARYPEAPDYPVPSPGKHREMAE